MTTFSISIPSNRPDKDVKDNAYKSIDASIPHGWPANLKVAPLGFPTLQRLRQAPPGSATYSGLNLRPRNNENSRFASNFRPQNRGRTVSSPVWKAKNKFQDARVTNIRCTSATEGDELLGKARDAEKTSEFEFKKTKSSQIPGTSVARSPPPTLETPVLGQVLRHRSISTCRNMHSIPSAVSRQRSTQKLPLTPRQSLKKLSPQGQRFFQHTKHLTSNVIETARSPQNQDGSISPAAYHERRSDGSSDFVHTVKTASLSNGSFSIFPRSLRIGRSTESSGFLSYNARHSMDSDRPLSNSSADDAAIRRSFKRRQILEELTLTEESYVADLKALVYLYSTLLASASSIPDRVRSSIQRNVNSLLHSHERLLQTLHRAAFHAAARKWADTASPMRLARSRRGDLIISEGNETSRRTRNHRFTRSSVDSEEVSKAHMRLGTSEPEDVLDITRIFNDTVTEFFAYEEYCANHDIIAHELQKGLPQLWSTYESGIESLAKAINAIDKKDCHGRKGLTVADLLIKPIQRICRYPLLLEDLLSQTPVGDSPVAHAELANTIYRLRDVVRAVNTATDNRSTRIHIQRRWLLQDRLDLSEIRLSYEEFRALGLIELCGVLHVTYQTATQIDGSFVLCILFEQHFLMALPSADPGSFKASALVLLADLNLQSATNGKGLQCPSALHSWKVCFAEQDSLQEFILSACSRVEEEQWMLGLQGNFRTSSDLMDSTSSLPTRTTLELKSIGCIYTSQRSLSRDVSIQRAATVNNKATVSQVILRNTHNAQDLTEYRAPSLATVNRSQSHMNAKRVPVLEPKRSSRARMEASISDIWTKERLPFPGMIGSKGGQIIRASAGSLVRKLSLASIHAPFSRSRTPSLTVSSKKSRENLIEPNLTFSVRKASTAPRNGLRDKPRDIPEVDDMRSVVGRMMAGSEVAARSNTSVCGENTLKRRQSKRARQTSVGIGPDDPAAIFYSENTASNHGHSPDPSDRDEDGNEAALAFASKHANSRRRKRWSNPMSVLRGWGSEAKVMLLAGK